MSTEKKQFYENHCRIVNEDLRRGRVFLSSWPSFKLSNHDEAILFSRPMTEPVAEYEAWFFFTNFIISTGSLISVEHNRSPGPDKFRLSTPRLLNFPADLGCDIWFSFPQARSDLLWLPESRPDRWDRPMVAYKTVRAQIQNVPYFLAGIMFLNVKGSSTLTP